MCDRNLPKISIVTPSFNQADYLEETIESVINQNYSNLEYIVIDGNSTDGSVDIIESYENKISYWVSENDAGQYDAINKGFQKTNGEIMGWLNSDDKYLQWTLSILSEVFSEFPEIRWLTTDYAISWDKKGRPVNGSRKYGFNKNSFLKGENLPGGEWFARNWIQQESTFWRRSLWSEVGSELDTSLEMAGDFELWTKFFQKEELYVVSAPLGGFRKHEEQKTAQKMNLYLDEAKLVLERYGGGIPNFMRCKIRQILYNLLGHKVIPKNRLGSIPQKIIDHLLPLYPVKSCIWTTHGWEIRKGYII